MQPQIVERRVVEVSPQLAVKLGHVVIGALGAVRRVSNRCRNALVFTGIPVRASLARLVYSDFACFNAVNSFGGALEAALVVVARPRLRSCRSEERRVGKESRGRWCGKDENER